MIDEVELQELVANFIHIYFAEVDEINTFNINFIESNNLLEPKFNYVKLYRFLNTALDNLRNLDPDILDDLVRKIYKDTKNLYEYILDFDKKNRVCELIYRRDFLDSIKPYQDLKADVEKTEALKNKYYMAIQTTDAQIKAMGTPKGELKIKEYKNLKRRNVDAISNYADSKTILEKLRKELILFEEMAFGEFKGQFFQAKNYYYESMTKIINVKLYYLDKILWIEAKKSKPISIFFERAQIKDEYSTKTFIKYYLRNINVSQARTSDWHNYLKSCLEEWGNE